MLHLVEYASTSMGIATITLCNSHKKNAINEYMNDRLIRLFQALEEDVNIRVVVIKATGDTFCSGIDLEWMARASVLPLDQNIHDAKQFVTLLQTIDTCPKPTIALVQGHCYGAGVGLLSVCDIVMCAPHTTFSFPEVKRGLVPAVVMPYIVRAIGGRYLKRLILTGMPITASEGHHLGLVHDIVPQDFLDQHCLETITQLLQGSPMAQAEAKNLLRYVSSRPSDQGMLNETARRLSVIRASKDAQKGMADFFAKKTCAW